MKMGPRTLDTEGRFLRTVGNSGKKPSPNESRKEVCEMSHIGSGEFGINRY